MKLILPRLGEGKLLSGKVVRLGEGKLRLGEAIRQIRLGESGGSYKHCFPTMLNLVQVGSCGGTPRAKGALPDFVK